MKPFTLLAFAFLFATSLASAHHSVPVNFDTSDTISISGTIVQTKWTNPHSQIVLEVATQNGETEIWLVEMNALNTINRMARQLDMATSDFVIGDPLTVIGWRGRNDRAIYFRKAVLSNGKEVVWETRLDPDLINLEEF